MTLTTTNDQVIIKGSTWAAIWHMSWPMVLYMSTISLANFTEVWVAGQLSSDIQAAVGIGSQIWYFMIMLTIALSAGTTALVSRYWGASDLETATQAARQSLYCALIFGFTSATIGILSCRFVLSLLGATPAVQQLGWDFLKFDLLSHIPLTLLWISNAIFRAKGNARIPMVSMGLVTSLVVLLDLGLCIWPLQLGISGLGVSWLLASIIGVILSLKFLRQSTIGGCVDFAGLFKGQLSHSWCWRIMKIGLPACIQDVAWVVGNFGLFVIFARLQDPTACQASWAVGLRVEEVLSSMPIYALSLAIATIVGQNLGANNPQRAELAGWQTAAVGVAYNTFIGALMFFLADWLAHLMSHNLAVVKYATSCFQILGLAEPFIALELILIGAMQGAGYTKWPMWVMVICLTVIKLPLAWYLSVHQHLGVNGTWISMSVCATAVGLLCAWRFKSGIWKSQQV